MNSITIEVDLEKVKAKLEKSAEILFFKDGYDNPLFELIEEAVREREDQLKSLVREIIGEVLTDPGFREKVTKVVISRLIDLSLKK